MTYGEAIEAHIEVMGRIYENCAGLRDCAAQNEKVNWNNLRRATSEAYDLLRDVKQKAIENKLYDSPLDGNFSEGLKFIHQ